MIRDRQRQCSGKQISESSIKNDNISANSDPVTLTEFKQYCQNYLYKDLLFFEQKRKHVLTALAVSLLLALVLISFVVKIFILHDRSFQIATFPFERGFYYQTIELLFYSVYCDRQLSEYHLNAQASIILICFGSIIISVIISIWIAFYDSCLNAYQESFQERVIQKIVNFIGNKHYLNQDLYPQGNLHQQTKIALASSFIFKQYLLDKSKIQTQNAIAARVNNIDIFFSSIQLIKNTDRHFLNSSAFTPFHKSHYRNLTKSNSSIDREAYGGLFIFSVYFYVICLSFLRLANLISYLIGLLWRVKIYDFDNFRENTVKIKAAQQHIFKGLFFYADFPKQFQATTFVVCNDLGRSRFLEKYEKVKLESSEFNQTFQVYSSNQIEARYLLSTSLMDRLLNFSQQTKKDFYLTFVDRKIYIAIPCNYNLLEPKLFTSMLSFAPLQEYFQDLQLTIGVIETLNLNRIP
jgi:hypothetical protein